LEADILLNNPSNLRGFVVAIEGNHIAAAGSEYGTIKFHRSDINAHLLSRTERHPVLRSMAASPRAPDPEFGSGKMSKTAALCIPD
jgi:hypothetical protein